MAAQHKPARRSLSSRLVVVFAVLLGLVLVAISALTALTLRSHLEEELDANLRSSAQLIRTQQLEQIIAASNSQVLPSDFYLYLADGEDGFAITLRETIDNYGEPQGAPALAQVISSEPYTVPGTMPNSSWRIMTIQLLNPYSPQPVGIVLIGLPLEPINQTVSSTIQTMAFLAAIIIVIGAAISYVLVQQSLRGLRDIERATHEVAAGNLSGRVPTTPKGTEVGLLGESINSMLSQIEESFARQAASEQRMRQFVSDASHELRTPLATVHGYTELYRLGGVPEEQVDLAISRIESESSRMAALVEDLLQLVRLDESRPLRWQSIELASVAINTVMDFLARAPGREAEVVSLDGGEVQSVVISGDLDKVTQVLSNLLSNVLMHTPEDTPVEVAVGKDATGDAVIEVRDYGPGIKREDRARVFERFYRTDASRSRERGGSGLGLAIVSAIMHTHGGSASVHETPGGGLTVRLTFPTKKPDTPDEKMAEEEEKAQSKIARATNRLMNFSSQRKDAKD